MKRQRRLVLQGLISGAALAGAGLLPGCKRDPQRDPQAANDTDSGEAVDLVPGDWEPAGVLDELAFPHGIQAGDVTPGGVILSVRTDLSEVSIELVEVRSGGWRLMAASSHEVVDGVVQIEVSGLVADQRHSWVVRGGDDQRSVQGWFRTAPQAGSSRVIRFGAVSCLGGNWPWPCLSRAAEEQLDVFLLLGDTIYADWGASASFRQKWSEALSQSGMVDLTASTSLIATWDDHEVFNNWSPATSDPATVSEARAAFRDAIPQRSGPNDAIWRLLQWGDVLDFFVLDCRGERQGSDYISRVQMDWLKEALVSSHAQFKIILNSVPITDLSYVPVYGTLEQEDRWQGYPLQRQELLATCAEVPGVLFISGDFHVGAAAFVDAPEGPGAEIIEILAGPGGSPISDQYRLMPEGGRIPKMVLSHNYTRFECDPDAGEIRVAWIDNDGQSIRTLTVLP